MAGDPRNDPYGNAIAIEILDRIGNRFWLGTSGPRNLIEAVLRAAADEGFKLVQQLTDDGWVRTDCFQPKDGLVVETKIDANSYTRNEAKLYRQGRMWWTPDGSMHMYYTPTHWRPLSDGDRLVEIQRKTQARRDALAAELREVQTLLDGIPQAELRVFKAREKLRAAIQNHLDAWHV